ncbi:major facilitator superfamily protein [Sarocladium implicatum]|nr:major facilitator superfamily protein [Sarocladium implicatum]
MSQKPDRAAADDVVDEKLGLSPTHAEYASLSTEDAEFMQSFTEKERKKVVRKIDMRVVPVLCSLYLMSFIDRANIGNAKIEGMMEDLNLTGDEYNIAVSIFFIGYVLLEIPSNVLLKKFTRPSYYLAILVILFGTCMTLHGVTTNFATLTVARFFLGVTESGLFPAAMYLVSTWYAPYEVGKRMSVFACTSTISGSVSGLLAYLIAKMKGTAGVNGWQWIFIIEGMITVLFGVLTPFILADSPSLAGRWLSEREIRYLNTRRYLEFGGRHVEQEGQKFQWKVLWSVLLDWKIYILILIYWSNTAPNFATKVNMPTIMTTMGYTSANAQLMTIPPYFVGACAAFVSAWFADRYKWRMPFILFPQLCIMAAFGVLFVYGPNIEDHIPAAYVAIVIACIGFAPITPGANAWASNNIAGPMRRAMGFAFMMGFGNIGGLIGSYIFIEEEKPRYPTGYGTAMAFGALGVICSLGLEFAYWMLNKRKERLTEEEVRELYTAEQLAAMGDKSPLYRYTL